VTTERSAALEAKRVEEETGVFVWREYVNEEVVMGF
jgi:hypothetical protein